MNHTKNNMSPVLPVYLSGKRRSEDEWRRLMFGDNNVDYVDRKASERNNKMKKRRPESIWGVLGTTFLLTFLLVFFVFSGWAIIFLGIIPLLHWLWPMIIASEPARMAIGTTLIVFLAMFLFAANENWKLLGRFIAWIKWRISFEKLIVLRRVMYTKLKRDTKQGFSKEYLDEAKKIVSKNH